MIPSLILVILIAAIAASFVVINRKRKPTTGEHGRNIGIDIKRGARDIMNATKDAAEDARNAVKDAAK